MNEVEIKLWRRVDRYVSFLNFIPFLKFVGVCNNLSFGIVDEKSDIDLFIIAKKGRLFFVRTLVTFVFHLLGVRRHGDKISSRFCLSFFVDDSRLSFADLALSDDVYLAFWVKKIMPVFNDGVFKDFVAANTWIRSYFSTPIVMESCGNLRNKSVLRNILTFVFDGKFGDFIENLLSKWQLKRAALKMSNLEDQSGLIVSRNILKFHNVDRRRIYRRAWFDRFEDKNITTEKFLEIARFR
ncbi:hypothetical protein COU74_03480 [Candidatus Peregrinibacteria bacterium CG10_big_fil_rev_8_21_14_0_10_36_19]|nr:MAG: hypothetical protein COU74_03480 [Candidatus Peregrinibacteria bacterium CG10_big_fil_rev_8_21_14_0_10_36_19]